MTEQKSVYQEIAENALMATGSRMVNLTRYDPARDEVVQVAFAGGYTTELYQRVLAIVRRAAPDFDPMAVTLKGDVNPLNLALYHEGRMVTGTLEEVCRGVVDERFVFIARTVMGVGHSFLYPLKIEDRVASALCFHAPHSFTEAEQIVCQAFARQAALTLENGLLMENLQARIGELQESRQQITAAEERLRREIAEMLHSRVQSKLLVAWHHLGQAVNILDTDLTGAKAMLNEIRDELDDIREREVRQASHLLHPSIIRVGLVPAVRSLAVRFEDYFRVTIDVDPRIAALDHPIDNQIPEPLRLVAYRVVEESLNNVTRHARAGLVAIAIRLDAESRLVLEVKDNGQGFDAGAMKPGLGLNSIAGRVEQFRGIWTVDGKVGRGTTVTAILPLQLGKLAEPGARVPRGVARPISLS